MLPDRFFFFFFFFFFCQFRLSNPNASETQSICYFTEFRTKAVILPGLHPFPQCFSHIRTMID